MLPVAPRPAAPQGSSRNARYGPLNDRLGMRVISGLFLLCGECARSVGGTPVASFWDAPADSWSGLQDGSVVGAAGKVSTA